MHDVQWLFLWGTTVWLSLVVIAAGVVSNRTRSDDHTEQTPTVRSIPGEHIRPGWINSSDGSRPWSFRMMDNVSTIDASERTDFVRSGDVNPITLFDSRPPISHPTTPLLDIVNTTNETRPLSHAMTNDVFKDFTNESRTVAQNTSDDVTATNTTDESRLIAHIMAGYNNAARPVFNASQTVTVKFGLTLTQISDMDEVNQVLTINVWLEQEWTDERLTWDPSDYNNLAVLRIPCEKLWLPDIVLYNSADDYTSGYMNSKAMVSHEGNVFWPPPAKFRSSCKIDITYFPFDDQVCELKFGSWTYDGFQVNITNRSASVDLQNYVYSGEWELMDVRVRRTEMVYACCPEPYPDVRFTIIIRRKTLYYLFNIIFPCLWLTILSLLGFWLPPDSGEKITLGITVLLAFSVFMLLIAESMPATSEFVPLIGIYLTVTMGMTSLSIILTVLVLQLHHVGPHKARPPRWLKSLVSHVLARLVCMPPRRRHQRLPKSEHPGPTLTVKKPTLRLLDCSDSDSQGEQQRKDLNMSGQAGRYDAPGTPSWDSSACRLYQHCNGIIRSSPQPDHEGAHQELTPLTVTGDQLQGFTDDRVVMSHYCNPGEYSPSNVDPKRWQQNTPRKDISAWGHPDNRGERAGYPSTWGYFDTKDRSGYPSTCGHTESNDRQGFPPVWGRTDSKERSGGYSSTWGQIDSWDRSGYPFTLSQAGGRGQTEEQYYELIEEWQFVAHVVDRLLFWLFLLVAVVSSLTILVLKPLFKPVVV